VERYHKNQQSVQRNDTSTRSEWATTLAWQDQWDGRVLKFTFPELYSFINDQNLTLEQTLQSNLADLFHLPLSQQAYEQFLILHDDLHSIITSQEVDTRTYI
jgi:hypothetical protein